MHIKFVQIVNSKKIYIPIILIVLIGVISIAGGCLMLHSKKTTSPIDANINYDLTKTNSITTCYNADCTNSRDDLFANMSYDSSSKKIKDIINKINKKTKEYYELAITPQENASLCSDELAKYNKHSYKINNQYSSYTTDKVVSISVKRSKLNLCTGEFNPYQVESYIYSLAEDKILTIDESMKLLNISSSRIKEAIKTNNEVLGKHLNIEINTKETYDDIVLYYDTIGNLYVSYYIEELNDYYPAELKENK